MSINNNPLSQVLTDLEAVQTRESDFREGIRDVAEHLNETPRGLTVSGVVTGTATLNEPGNTWSLSLSYPTSPDSAVQITDSTLRITNPGNRQAGSILTADNSGGFTWVNQLGTSAIADGAVGDTQISDVNASKVTVGADFQWPASSIPPLNLFSVHEFPTVAERNGVHGFAWNSGDVAVVVNDPTVSNNGAYFYTGPDQNAPAATTNAMWSLIPTGTVVPTEIVASNTRTAGTPVLTATNDNQFTWGAAANPVVVSGTAPTSPDEGDLWFDCDNCLRLLVYTGDEWVDASPAGVPVIPNGTITAAQLAPGVVGNGTLTVRQGTTTLGTFSANQAGNQIISVPTASNGAITFTGDVTGSVTPAANAQSRQLTIAANAVGANELANNAVDTAAIANNAVTSAKIAANTITAADIAPNAVGASELANNAVDTAAIVNDAVTNAKIATNAVNADSIAANAVGASELNVNGNGTATQLLTSDGDGSFSWVDRSAVGVPAPAIRSTGRVRVDRVSTSNVTVNFGAAYAGRAFIATISDSVGIRDAGTNAASTFGPQVGILDASGRATVMLRNNRGNLVDLTATVIAI